MKLEQRHNETRHTVGIRRDSSLSSLKGEMIHGMKLVDGGLIFRFFPNNNQAKGDSHSHDDGGTASSYHLNFSLVERSKKLTRVAPSSGSNQEIDPNWKCSVCKKLLDDCTCVTVKGSYCHTCKTGYQKSKGETCKCCALCGRSPCQCYTPENNPTEPPPMSTPEGGVGGGTGGGIGSGGIGGGSSGGTKPQTGKKTTTEKLRSTAKETVNKMTKLHGSSKAVCNFGVQNAFRAIFGTLPAGMNCQANQMVRYWGNTPQSWQRITINEAQDYANRGYFVVAGWVNPSGSSGHVVLIVPGTAEYHNKWGANLPKAMDTGRGKRSESNGIENSFGIQKKNQLQFYFYK